MTAAPDTAMHTQAQSNHTKKRNRNRKGSKKGEQVLSAWDRAQGTVDQENSKPTNNVPAPVGKIEKKLELDKKPAADILAPAPADPAPVDLHISPVRKPVVKMEPKAVAAPPVAEAPHPIEAQPEVLVSVPKVQAEPAIVEVKPVEAKSEKAPELGFFSYLAAKFTDFFSMFFSFNTSKAITE